MTVDNELLRQAKLMRDKQEWTTALGLYDEFLKSHPDCEEALICAGGCLQYLRRHQESLLYYDRVILIDPESMDAHFNRGLALLSLGRLSDGWQEYEWRLRRISSLLPPYPFLTANDVKHNLMGRKVLIHSEQGFGDSILCIRYARLLAELGVEVIVSVQPELARLFTHIDGITRVVPHGDLLPCCDFQVAMMSLPSVFETTLGTVPAEIPYIVPPLELVSAWKKRMPETDRARVGLVWSASKSNLASGALRSMRFEALSPLFEDDLIDFYSLQVGSHLMSETARFRDSLIDLTAQITDFADTAAMIVNLDLVITIDTAVAHLAGALGRNTFLLVPWNRDWRWYEYGGRSIWYPEIHIFSQEKPDNWSGVMQNVRKKLHIMLDRSGDKQ